MTFLGLQIYSFVMATATMRREESLHTDRLQRLLRDLDCRGETRCSLKYWSGQPLCNATDLLTCDDRGLVRQMNMDVDNAVLDLPLVKVRRADA
jgi:hypothetical protein